jgi:catechol 2,3-dioxygenase-like lactoylglutathione lyase family enzyme
MKFDTGEINIICTELDRSLQFYHHILGFELIEREGVACRLRFGSTTLLLLPLASNPLPQRRYCSAPTVSLDLMVADIFAAADYFREHNISFEEDVDPNLKRCIIRDPDGMFLEIVQKA